MSRSTYARTTWPSRVFCEVSQELERGAPPHNVAAPHTEYTQIEGERRVITALLADVEGSTDLAEQMDVETWVEIINRVFQILEAEIDHFGGQVDQFRGDCVVAFFGTPVAHEDDPERAVRAALAMQDKLSLYATELNATREAAHEQPINLQIRIGVNTGEVIAARVGNHHRHSEDTAMGRAIAVAARMETAAEPGTVLVAQDTYRLVEPLFEWQALGKIAVKGVRQPISVYRPLAHRAIRGKGRGIAGLSSPLVGRQAQFQALQQAIQRLGTGVGSVVTLVGEAGIGKSRLVTEVSKLVPSAGEGSANLRSAHLAWIEGRCLSYASGTAYQLWIDMLQVLLGLPPDAAQSTVQNALRERVHRLCLDRFDQVYPYLCRLMALPLEGVYETLDDLQGESLRAEVFRAAEILIECAARRRPLVVVCEDLHWADPSSLALLGKLLPLIERVPVLFLCVFRPETEHGCWQLWETAARFGSPRHVDVQLPPLSAADSKTLVDNLLQIQDLPSTLRDQILGHAEGNPFYVEEIIRSLINADAVAHDSTTGRWRATQEVTDLALPNTLNGVLRARIDRLPPKAKQILQLASVIGRIFARRALAAVASISDEQERRALDTHLMTLVDAQLVRRRTQTTEPEYIFKHELTREAAYNSLLRRERRAIHQKVAETLEQLYADRTDEQLGLLAHHWQQAGDRGTAVDYLLRAGEQARTAYANEEALVYYRKALALLDTSPLAESWESRRLTASGGIGRVLFGIGQVDESESPLREAIALGQQIGLAPRELVRLYYWLGEVLYWQGRFDALRQVGNQGLAALGTDTECVEAALMNSHIAISYEVQQQEQRAREALSPTKRFIEQLPYTEELRPTYDRLFWSCMGDKDVQGALAWNSILLQKANAHHDLRALASVFEHSAGLLGRTGDLHGAVEQTRQALELFARIQDAKHTVWCFQNLSQVYLRLGDLGKARDYAHRALDAAEAAGAPHDVWLANEQIGLVALCQGDLAQAESTLLRARSLCEESGSFKELSTSYLLSRICLARGDRAGALRHCQTLDQVVEKNRRVVQDSFILLFILVTLEEAFQDPKAFRAACRRMQKTQPYLAHPSFVQWYLDPALLCAPVDVLRPPDVPGLPDVQDVLADALPSDWTWHDPLGDCFYAADGGVEIRAANGRDLIYLNRSAPRLLRTASGDLAAQTACLPVSQDMPAIGGLMMWRDEHNFLRLDRGVLGQRQISFGGCLASKDVAIGQGRLPTDESGRVYLRLERAAAQVRALCSADGRSWFTVGRVSFPDESPVQIGVHAIGNVPRWIYPGAYPEGTAIRFESFQFQST